MDKQKNFFKAAATNKMMWITLIIGAVIIIATTATICGITYMKTKTETKQASTNEIQDKEETIIKQSDLVDISKMSEEELKKLNEEETKKAEEENKKNKTNIKKSKNRYYIKVNYGAQVVTVYTYDSNGKYTIPVKAFVCSTGAATPPSGVYNLGGKWVWGALYGDVYGHYCSVIVGDILFHSVPYNQPRNDTLVSTYYDRLGTKDSMGCIRLTTIDAKWIFDNCPSGTQIEFYSSSNPGPLGKPSATKVSNMPGNLKNWDPTDPDSRNPWIKYFTEQKKKNENAENKTENTTTNNNTSVDNTIGNIGNTIQNIVTNIGGNEIKDENTDNNDVGNSEINKGEETGSGNTGDSDETGNGTSGESTGSSEVNKGENSEEKLEGDGKEDSPITGGDGKEDSPITGENGSKDLPITGDDSKNNKNS